MTTIWNPQAVVNVDLAPLPSSPRLGVTKKGRRHGQISAISKLSGVHRPLSPSAALPELAQLTLPEGLLLKFDEPQVEAKSQLWWRPVRTANATRKISTPRKATVPANSTPRPTTSPAGTGLSEEFRLVLQAYHESLLSERLPEVAFMSETTLAPTLLTTGATFSPSTENSADSVPPTATPGIPISTDTTAEAPPADRGSAEYRSVRARAGHNHLVNYYFHPPPPIKETIMFLTLTLRRSLEDSNGCPICTEDICCDDDTAWCRAQCGQNMHRECFLEWKQYCQDASRPVTCPCCRQNWRWARWDWE